MIIRSMGAVSVLITLITVLTLTSLSNRGDAVVEQQEIQVPDSFANMWLVYDMATVAMGVVMELNDGTVTSSVNEVMQYDVEISRRSKPSKWTSTTRVESGNHYFVSDASVPVSDGFKLQGCFSLSNLEQFPALSDAAYRVQELCFDTAGNITNRGVQLERHVKAAKVDTTHDVQHGYYRVADNMIELELANGFTAQAVLGAYRFGGQMSSVSAISIGELIFLADNT